MFKVNSKDTRATSMTSFTPFSGISIVDFEHILVLCSNLCKIITSKINLCLSQYRGWELMSASAC